MKRSPKDTSKETYRIPFFGGNPNQILAQEAEGQKSFVESTTLPTKIGDKDKAILEKCGVVFGDVVEGDDLFQYATLPDGWEKKSTDHSMWSELVDDKGRKRAGIFYKAAFYDRGAHMSLDRRYGYSYDYDKMKQEQIYIGIVTDGDEVIHSTKSFPQPEPDDYVAYEKVQELAKEWLSEHYPDWEDVAAYWNTQ